MIDILDYLHKYVPSISVTNTIEIELEQITQEHEILHPIFFGGDQLTVSCARSVKDSKISEKTPANRLEGIEPIFEDWHCRLCLLDVSTLHTMHICMYAHAYYMYVGSKLYSNVLYCIGNMEEILFQHT